MESENPQPDSRLGSVLAGYLGFDGVMDELLRDDHAPREHWRTDFELGFVQTPAGMNR